MPPENIYEAKTHTHHAILLTFSVAETDEALIQNPTCPSQIT